MSELTSPSVEQEDDAGIRWITIREQRLGWSVDTQRFKRELHKAIEGATRVAVDLSDVAYMASPTIGVILGFHRHVTRAGCRLAFFDARQYVWETFEALGLTDVMNLCRSRRETRELLLAE